MSKLDSLAQIARDVDAGRSIMPWNVRWLLEQILEQQKEIVRLQDMLILRNSELIEARQKLLDMLKAAQ